jgi:hypothetical protein
MKLMLQCRGPDDKDWFILNSVSTVPKDPEARRAYEKRLDKHIQGWSQYFYDHQFRIVTK